MMNAISQALTQVCDELERYDPNAPALHFARGLLAAANVSVTAPSPAPSPVIAGLTHGNRKGMGLTMDNVIADYQAGATLMELGAKYGVSYMTIQRRLVDCGVHIRPRTNKIERDTPAIAAAYRAGATLTEISAQFGFSPSTVRQALRAADVPMRTRGRVWGRSSQSEQREREIITLRQQGRTCAEIANKFGITRQRVSQIVGRYEEAAA